MRTERAQHELVGQLEIAVRDTDRHDGLVAHVAAATVAPRRRAESPLGGLARAVDSLVLARIIEVSPVSRTPESMRHLLPVALVVCASLAPAQWSTPTLSLASSAVSDFDPCPTFDGLKLYIAVQVASNFEIFAATRTAPYAQFGAATQIMELASTGVDAGPCVRIDDCEIFFYSGRPGGVGSSDIWRATRPAPVLPWGAPTNVMELNTTGSDSSPSLTADGLRICFQRGGTFYIATRPNWTTPFSTPTPISELVLTGEREPHISADGLAIYFSSTRAGGAGGTDTWMARRLDLNSPFTNITNLAPLNLNTADVSPSIALFGDEIFFCSSRTGGPGSYDIYTSRFTGLVANGVASMTTSQSLRFSDPGSPNFVYVGAAALGDTPGLQLGARVLPLNPDSLFGVSIGGLAPILTGYTGLLDTNGLASGAINFQGYPFLIGFRFFSAFVVLDTASPFGFRTLSNSHEVLVQP